MAHQISPSGDEAWFPTCTSLATVIPLCVAESPGLVLEGASKDLQGLALCPYAAVVQDHSRSLRKFPTVTPSLPCKRSAFLLPERSLLPYGRCILLFLNDADLFVNKKFS